MTTPPPPNYSMWGMPPTLARRYEPSSDLVALVVVNLNTKKAFSFKTSRPYVVFVRLVNQMATGISAREINEALNNLVLCGTSVVARHDLQAEERFNMALEVEPRFARHEDILVKFMFYLEYVDDPMLPTDPPYEVDPKMAVNWPEEFLDIEALLVQKNYNSPVDDGDEIPL